MLGLLFLYIHLLLAADKIQLYDTELGQLVAAVQRKYVRRAIDKGMQQLNLAMLNLTLSK